MQSYPIRKLPVLKPDFATAFNNLGIAYQRLGMIRFSNLENFKIAIDVLPGFASSSSQSKWS